MTGDSLCGDVLVNRVYVALMLRGIYYPYCSCYGLGSCLTGLGSGCGAWI